MTDLDVVAKRSWVADMFAGCGVDPKSESRQTPNCSSLCGSVFFPQGLGFRGLGFREEAVLNLEKPRKRPTAESLAQVGLPEPQGTYRSKDLP